VEQLQHRLIDTLAGYGRVAVALSAGVDSSVVAKAAAVALGDSALAVTALSPSLAEGELDIARAIAKQCGLRHEVLRTDEFGDPNYAANPSHRCYFCKTELYQSLWSRRVEWGFDVIVNGTNLDDLGDHRPGLVAANENGVRSPLVECGLRKADVRALARAWELPVWDKPAAPCLASRIAYGIAVTPERVRRIDAAERWLRETLGVRELRVRVEADDAARIELPRDSIPAAMDAATLSQITAHLQSLGFATVTIDPQGYRPGSLNERLAAHELVTLNPGERRA
jgi:uncharacterized protein